MKKKILLIDGHNLLFRMYYGIPSVIKNSKGIDIRGLVGFIGSIKKLVDLFKPFSIFVVFDSETSKNNNLKLDNNYKANRIDYSNYEDNPFNVLPLIKKSLKFLNINYIEVINYEADDYISSLCNNNLYEYIIVSTDRDFIQLVSSNVFLYVPNGKNSILYNEEEVINKFNIPVSKYILYKSIIGDKSDNIKGIRGIGKKTAEKILKYNSIDNYILDNNSKITNLLINNRELINKNIQLITLNKNIKTNIIFNPISDLINLKTYEIIKSIDEF